VLICTDKQPKFLSKEERTKLALAQRAAEIEALKDKQAQEKLKNLEFLKKAQELERVEKDRQRNSKDRWGTVVHLYFISNHKGVLKA
jgi:hypothetical protein